MLIRFSCLMLALMAFVPTPSRLLPPSRKSSPEGSVLLNSGRGTRLAVARSSLMNLNRSFQFRPCKFFLVALTTTTCVSRDTLTPKSSDRLLNC
jgi:hypothetical protein